MDASPVTLLASQAATPLKGHQGKLPSFNSITKQIEQENALLGALSRPMLVQYELQRKKFEDQGFSHTTTCLIKAFCYELESVCAPLKEIALMKSVSLFSTLLMFHEYEIVVWFCFCSSESIKDLLKEATHQDKKFDVGKANKLMVNHLINTAFFTKKQVTTEKQFEQYQAFFDSNFSIFQGKHTDWLLLNEPDTSVITPLLLTQKFNQMVNIYDRFVSKDMGGVSDKKNIVDFNEIALNLLLESEMQADLQQWRQDERKKAKIFQITKKENRKRLKKEFQKQQVSSAQVVEKYFSSTPPHSTSQHNDVQAFRGRNDILQKTVSNMIIQQLTTPSGVPKPAAHNGVSTPMRLRSNLNDSLMWQTMQSNIYDMNTIMRSLIDENQIKPLESSNYVTTMGNAFPENLQNYNIGAGNNSQIGLQQLFNGNRIGGSSMLNIYNQPQQAHQVYQQAQNCSQLFQQQSGLNFLQNLAQQHNLTTFQGGQPPSLPHANLYQQNSLLGASSNFQTKNPLVSSINPPGSQMNLNQMNTNITSFLRSYSHLGLNNVAQQAQQTLQLQSSAEVPKQMLSLASNPIAQVPAPVFQQMQNTFLTELGGIRSPRNMPPRSPQNGAFTAIHSGTDQSAVPTFSSIRKQIKMPCQQAKSSGSSNLQLSGTSNQK